MATNPITYLCADCGKSGSIDLSGTELVIVSTCDCVKENA